MLILVMGLPGSGKTYFAKALAARIGGWHTNTDTIRKEMGKMGDYEIDTKKQVYEELLRRTEKGLYKYPYVIIDATFFKKSLREPYRDLADRLQLPIHLIEIRAKPSTVAKRLTSKRADSEADFEVHQIISSQFESVEGEHLTIWSDHHTLEEMLQQALQFLKLVA